MWNLFGILILTIVSASGCGNGLSTVSGTVTLDGKPVEGSSDIYGTVSFVLAEGGGAPAVGIITGNGQYEISTGTRTGIEPGNYAVGISVRKIHPPAEPGGLTRPEQLSHRKYAMPETSGFSAEVKPGSNTFDFALSSTNK